MSALGYNENVVAYRGYYRSEHVTQICMELCVGDRCLCTRMYSHVCVTLGTQHVGR